MSWQPNLCRTCGLIGDICYPIFEKESNRDIEMKLKKYFNLNVLGDDFKPKEICSHCIIKIDKYIEFSDLCYTTNEKFESILYQHQQNHLIQQQQCWNDKVSLPDGEKNGVIVAAKADQEHFTDCSDIIMMVQYKENGLLPQTENLDVTSCGLNDQDMLSTFQNIDIDYVTSNYEQNHTVLRHSGKSYVENVQQNLTVNKYKNNYIEQTDELCSLKDSITNKKCKKIKCLKLPLVSVDSVRNSIKPNEKQLNENEKQLNENEKQLNENEKQFNENKCHIVSLKTNKNQLGSKPFACLQCNKSFMRKLTLNAHMSVHTNVRPHVCKICDKSFALRWDLTCHQRLHTDLYRCTYCSKPFSVPSKLERHIRIHTNVRPYACPEKGCGKTFSDKRNLVGHKSSHSDIRDFECITCGKKYKTKSQLNEHKRVHSNATPYKCSVCSKSYKWKTNLLLHMRKHDGYKCYYCKKDCEKLSVLIKHRKECKNNKDT